MTSEQRIISRQDFHIPTSEIHAPDIRTLSLEAIIAFPELDDEQGDHSAIPEFFRSMSIADENGRLKCRLRLDAQWDDDGTIDGYVTSQFHALTCWGNDEPDDSDFHKVRPGDRAKIQLIYIPATRSATAQVSSFLKGRLWKAINWSSQVRASFAEKAHELNSAFEGESAIDAITGKLTQRWQQLHSAGTDSTPKFRPVDVRFEEFVRKVDVLLHPDESGRDRSIEELSDGQSSLFHIAMTSATLDVEREIRLNSRHSAFLYDDLPLPSLTLLALEEPENNLSPHYLSRIISQLNELTENIHAQAIISSHSSSILARIAPTQIRHFRLDVASKNTIIKELTLPKEDNDAAKYIQQAVRAWPELYFAKVVVLGEGASEEVILPAVAGAMRTPVGDYKQRIMGWAGARTDAFHQFEHDFSAIRYQLQLNHRSSPELVRLQHIVAREIENGVYMAQTNVSQKIDKGCAFILNSCSVVSEVNYIAKWISRNIQSRGLRPRDYAILARKKPENYYDQLNQSLVNYHLKLRNESIKIGNTTLQDLLAEEFNILFSNLLRFVIGQKEPRIWGQVYSSIEQLRGISPDDIRAHKTIENQLVNLKNSIQALLEKPYSAATAQSTMEHIISFISPSDMRKAFSRYNAGDLLNITLEALEIHFLQCVNNTSSWQDCVDEFDGVEHIPLMTIHKSKGLEFDTVIFIGLDDNAWWSHQPGNAESMSTFFVALSRAKQRAVFSFCSERGKRQKLSDIYALLEKSGVKEYNIN